MTTVLDVHYCNFNISVILYLLFSHTRSSCAARYNFIPITFGVIMYITYIMECGHDYVKRCKIKKVSCAEADEYIKKVCAATPIVWWKSICYHYVRRTRQITRYRNGEAITSTQAYYQRANSHTFGDMFIYDICGVKDISKKLVDINHFGATKIHFSKNFLFASVQAAAEFEQQRSRFFGESELQDDYMEAREGFDFAEMQFIDELLVNASSYNTSPWYLKSAVFWCCSLLLLSWPLRFIRELRTAIVEYEITKLFGTNYISPSNLNFTGNLNHNFAAAEVVADRTNYFVVPSYSEAMRLDVSYQNDQFLFSNVRRQNRNSIIPLGNEDTVIPNYGAIGSGVHDTPQSRRVNRQSSFTQRLIQRFPRRSRSLNSMLARTFSRNDRVPLISQSPIPRSVAGMPPRSLSISALSTRWLSSGYEPIDEQDVDDCQHLVDDIAPSGEPPPPYEVALRMCAPLYDRLRRSANSITSRISSLSHSTSKDFSLRQQRAGHCSSRNDSLPSSAMP
uniref:Transmembrane protein 151B n=1 Tax=Syphacia muris TaxID=451379 RepID=A0A0N5ATH1_9BILA